MSSRLEQLCVDKGLKMTDPRRIIARGLSEAAGHPDVDSAYRRAVDADARTSIATVDRTAHLIEEANIPARRNFGDGRARYEEMPSDHHDHLIDVQSGRGFEFHHERIETLWRAVTARPGSTLVDRRREPRAVPVTEGDGRAGDGPAERN